MPGNTIPITKSFFSFTRSIGGGDTTLHDEKQRAMTLPPTMTSLTVATCAILLCFLVLCQEVQGEIREFNMLLDPDSSYINYIEGFLIAPGDIDLTNLRFATAGDSVLLQLDDDGDLTEPGNGGTFDDTESGGEENDDGNRRRRRADESAGEMDKNSDAILYGTQVDVAVFHLPSECAGTRAGCRWPDLGVGRNNSEGITRYCCSNDAIDMQLCEGSQYGKLILDSNKFSAKNVAGKHRIIDIPPIGEINSTLKFGTFEEKENNGKYILLLANCNDEGRPVLVSGKGVWKSVHGFLPGDLFGLMYFFGLLTFVYFGLLTWYGIKMKLHEEHTIPIQQWIFATICMGTLELFFRSGDLFVWNEDGYRFWVAFYVGVIVGVLKRGISRCLVVMVAMGWGVIRDDLGDVMKKINFLGGLYVVVSLVRDIITVVAYTEVQVMSQEEEDELFDVVTILTLVIAFIDVIFYLWIIDSLNATMEYLESMSQMSKLLRYLRLRCILLFSILFAVVWSVFGIVDSYDEGIVDQEQEWVMDASMELNYILVLIGVAILWRPNENAKEYAFVMELPAMTDDGEGGQELELTGVIPSAADSDDEDEYIGGRPDTHFKDDSFEDEPQS